MGHSNTAHPTSATGKDRWDVPGRDSRDQTVERVAGKDSAYYRQLPASLENTLLQNCQHMTAAYAGVVRALRKDVEGGYLTSLEKRITANVYGDFLDQARALLDADRKSVV